MTSPLGSTTLVVSGARLVSAGDNPIERRTHGVDEMCHVAFRSPVVMLVVMAVVCAVMRAGLAPATRAGAAKVRSVLDEGERRTTATDVARAAAHRRRWPRGPLAAPGTTGWGLTVHPEAAVSGSAGSSSGDLSEGWRHKRSSGDSQPVLGYATLVVVAGVGGCLEEGRHSVKEPPEIHRASRLSALRARDCSRPVPTAPRRACGEDTVRWSGCTVGDVAGDLAMASARRTPSCTPSWQGASCATSPR